MAKEKLHEIRLIFDNRDAANSFVAHWLDGGGDGGGNLDWNTSYDDSDDWTKKVPKFIRIKGTGDSVDE